MKILHAKEAALQFLYQYDLRGDETMEELPSFFAEMELSIESQQQSRILIKGCLSNWDALNKEIARVSKNWDLDRMPAIDRTILRIAAFQLLFQKDAKTNIVINEAILLAKRFSTQNSGRFINGILDNLRSKSVETSDVKSETQNASDSFPKNNDKQTNDAKKTSENQKQTSVPGHAHNTPARKDAKQILNTKGNKEKKENR